MKSQSIARLCIISICVVSMFCALFFLSSKKVNSAAFPTASEQSIKKSALQKKAVMAQNMLVSSWGFDNNGNVLYPESFAGYWIEGDQLIIGITNYSRETMNQYYTSVGSYSECLKFIKMQYGYNFLNESSHKICSFLEEKGAPVSQYYVDKSENAIVIGLACEEEDLAKWELLLEAAFEGIPVTVVSLPYVETATTFLKGADKLCNTTVNCAMALSCCGTFNGSSVILTCGHQVQSYGDQIRYLYGNGSIIGTVVYHRFGDYQTGDFEFISVNTSLFDISRSMANYRTYDGLIYNPDENTEICYYTRVTPGEHSGTVYAENVNVIAKENPEDVGVHVNGLTKIAVSSGGSIEKGDSGGPVYCVDENYAVYCGVIHGYNSINNNLFVFFTPYEYMYQAGFTAYVSD